MEAEQGMFARFLGWKTRDGDPDPERLRWKVGEVIEVFSSEHPHKDFPVFFWLKQERTYLRPTEYELLPSGPINLDDYL